MQAGLAGSKAQFHRLGWPRGIQIQRLHGEQTVAFPYLDARRAPSRRVMQRDPSGDERFRSHRRWQRDPPDTHFARHFSGPNSDCMHRHGTLDMPGCPRGVRAVAQHHDRRKCFSGKRVRCNLHGLEQTGLGTGRIERGIVKVGDALEIVGMQDEIDNTTCTGVEMFRKLLDQGQAGDNIGALLRGTKREDIERGQVLAKPGSITPHTNFECEVYVLKKEEGGRHTPFFKGYRPQFYFRTTDVTGACELPADTEMVMPGDNVTMTVELIHPIAMEEGLRFAIREGGRTVGAGVVTKITV